MIDKEISSNVDLGRLSRDARLLYALSIVHADDEGRMRAEGVYLKGKVFPYDDDLTSTKVQELRNQLASIGQITLYTKAGKEYLCHPNWDRWQPIRKDREKPSDCPAPTDDGCQLVDRRFTNGTPYHTVPDLTKPKRTLPEVSLFFTFQEIYDLYPNKDSRKDAERHFKASVKTEQDYANIKTAVVNYVRHLQTETWKQPQSAKTWFNNWRDWVNYKGVTIKAPEPLAKPKPVEPEQTEEERAEMLRLIEERKAKALVGGKGMSK